MDFLPLAGYPLGIGLLLGIGALLVTGKLRHEREVQRADRYSAKLEERCDRMTAVAEALAERMREQQMMFDRSLRTIEELERRARGQP